MDYCGPAGIPYLAFLDWDPLSRDAALAWQARRNETCGGCGTARSDWMNGRDEHGNLVANTLAPTYLTEDIYCPGCGALELHRKNAQDGPESAPGVRPGFVRNPHAAHLENAADKIPAPG